MAKFNWYKTRERDKGSKLPLMKRVAIRILFFTTLSDGRTRNSREHLFIARISNSKFSMKTTSQNPEIPKKKDRSSPSSVFVECPRDLRRFTFY